MLSFLVLWCFHYYFSFFHGELCDFQIIQGVQYGIHRELAVDMEIDAFVQQRTLTEYDADVIP